MEHSAPLDGEVHQEGIEILYVILATLKARGIRQLIRP